MARTPAIAGKTSDPLHHNPNLNPYFRFDNESKHIKDSVFSCRGIIINERFWNRIHKELMDLSKDSGPVILYQLGLNYGWEVGGQGKDLIKDPLAAVNFLEYYGLLAGWGRFEASELQLTQGRLAKPIVVKVFDNFFARAAGRSETGNPGCFFLSGLIAGVVDALFGAHHNCLEDKCISAGSECCEFVVARMTMD
ncbi:V4R domain-containing protein [Nitrososphaera viennensis]|uniref:4-vinyl reductase 4VR domain-containing protein n=2 Tax=Nitrososphaera viennensis TaxID=1034015 RepID=A0A060HHV0_9ARCH|nr:V4R domain-containing protein [Nitrososphaera viennensis]AIC16174.1 hypothetical protein NVIE_019160 [Nitrososphaera viennensis EN76]UVS68131.1 hypothetical protein NWT39_09495 [Nitrososphaera viennensis]